MISFLSSPWFVSYSLLEKELEKERQGRVALPVNPTYLLEGSKSLSEELYLQARRSRARYPGIQQVTFRRHIQTVRNVIGYAEAAPLLASGSRPSHAPYERIG